MDLCVLIIDDDIQRIKEGALIWELEDKFGSDNIAFESDPNEAINYIEENLHKNIIILLDIQFPDKVMNGHEILSKIREISELIPVILWSAVSEDKETFSDFINNNAFGFLSKSATSEEMLLMIDRAISYFKTSLDNTIEDWIIQKDGDKDKPVYFTSEGRSYSLNQILNEIRTQTDVGKSFAKKLNELTIDLLLRNKETLND